MIIYKTGHGIKFYEEVEVLMRCKVSMMVKQGESTRIISLTNSKFTYWDNKDEMLAYLRVKAEKSMQRSMKFVFRKGDEFAKLMEL